MNFSERNGVIGRIRLRVILFGMLQLMRITVRRHPFFRERVRERNFTAQIKVDGDSLGRFFTFRDGRILSGSGIHPQPDLCLTYRSLALAGKLLTPWRNQLDQINAMKNFQVDVQGPDPLVKWFFETLSLMMSAGLSYGSDLGKGTKRYVSGTNGGPVFVYVKDGRIVRVTPIEFDGEDARPWTIRARGKSFTPPRRTTVSPYTLAWKSMVYSPDRLLYPMKRVDFDPNGNRNGEKRGVSGYERISWDQALDIVAGEIKRVKREYGPGAILTSSGSHHTWGHTGYYISCWRRFMNAVGSTTVVHNPDSWEGWHWGGMHHWGNSMRLGGAEPYGTVEDALKECEMMVFWSSDPECTSGAYGAFEGTVRRQWLKELGIKMVHIDPFYNHTAAFLGGKWLAPRPATGNALALAIAHVWITEGLYDKEYVAKRTTGFDRWRDYILGEEDGVPKTPEWQEAESGIPAREVKALAREWGRKKTYLAAGGGGGVFGGACRCATGIEWARSMVCLMAMQGIGKPGVNMGNMQSGAPVDTRFFFPGYAEGGMSGDLERTALAVNMYQRMPQLPTMNTTYQTVPRLRIPEAILEGQCSAYFSDPKTIEGQFRRIHYPAPGNAPIRMYYKYGGSFIATMQETNRYVKAYRTDNLDFVVNQSIWFEGEAKFADVLLPACTSFERWDISEWSNSAGYVLHNFNQLNHRVIHMQHKCIEPLGESKSDYDIFFELSARLGLAAVYSEGMTQLDWCKRLFDATDLPKAVSWRRFLKKGYYVVPAPPEEKRDRCAYRWFAEDRKKDLPEISPLPSEYKEEFRAGLQTQSGKIEFDCSSLKRFDPADPERPTISKYIPSWEGHRSEAILEKHPLQLISPHPRFTFHTMGDGKGSFVNDVKDHRVLIDGYYYWIVRIHPSDASIRGIGENDLVRVFNDRGAVLCAAQVTERIRPGTVHSYEGSAIYDPTGEPGESTDRGGCINLLTSKRFIIEKSHSMASNSCLVQIERWGEVGQREGNGSIGGFQPFTTGRRI